jgi:hypothetical protein
VTARKLKAIGYWFNPVAPNEYPRVDVLVEKWNSKHKRAVLAHLKKGVVFERYRGVSFCRFACGISRRDTGSSDMFDGTWIWPEGLSHYVEVHTVQLPPAFIAHVLASRRLQSLSIVRPTQREGLVDTSLWVAWGATQGATVNLAEWAIPSWQQRDNVDKAIKATVAADHVLWRRRLTLVLIHRRQRAAVHLLHNGTIALTRFTKGKIANQYSAATTTVLDNWSHWNKLQR